MSKDDHGGSGVAAPAGWQDWRHWVGDVDWSDWRAWLQRVGSADWAAGQWAPAPWEQPPRAGEWNPPPFLTGCSQAVVPDGGPALIRNYDWDYRLFNGVVARTAYAGRRVLGTLDCLWGLLDGVNDAGLAVSLTFGGRP